MHAILGVIIIISGNVDKNRGKFEPHTIVLIV
jgi:hypothetical protein